jgi:hypothetical protein
MVAEMPHEGQQPMVAYCSPSMIGQVPELFAHQGGWDEALFVLVPIAVFAALLAVVNRR